MLKLHRIYVRAKKVFYEITDDCDDMIVSFDNISDAGVVLRYLNGVPMSETELARAVRLLDAVDDKRKGAASND